MNAPEQLFICNGYLVNPDWRGYADILVRAGKIVGIFDPGAYRPTVWGDTEIINAAGKWVLPGGVDPHVHIGLPLGEFTTLDDYESCTRAALYGGTTTLVDFAIPAGEDVDPISAFERRREMARKALIDVALHGCIVNWTDTTAEEIRTLFSRGVATIKVFTTYREVVMADPYTVRRVLATVRDLGGLVYVHAETDWLVAAAQEKLAAEGRIDAHYHAQSRPPICEIDAVGMVLSAAELEQAAVYFVHLTTSDAVETVYRARMRGIRAFAETCPHYLLLDDSVYARPDAPNFVCSPPMRTREVVDRLLRYVLSGCVDTIGSDHCCYCAC